MVAITLSGALTATIGLRRSEDFVVEIDLDIQPGETVALLGPNGAGKSTVVAAIAGLVPIDSGRVGLGDVTLDDPAEEIFVPPEQRRIGVVFQDILLFPHLSVAENIGFGLRAAGANRLDSHNRVARWIHRVDLDGLEGSLPHELSGGQAQRTALARALVTEPDMLLLDEPLSALDVTARSSMRRTIDEHLHGFAGPRLLITHDPVEAFLLADEILVIEAGSVTQQGSADEIRLRPRTPYAADLAGANLLKGVAMEGEVRTAGHIVHIADKSVRGQVLMTIHPSAVAVHQSQPAGSPRNVWETVIERFEILGDRVRLRTGNPLPLTIEVTRAAADDLGLAIESVIWVAIKATEIGVEAQSNR